MATSLGYSTYRKSEYSSISFFMSNSTVLTIPDVMYFANSSTVPSFVALLFIVSIGPLMQEFIFAVIHLYIVCGITLCLMPSILLDQYLWNIYHSKIENILLFLK
jgi:hypothetical protein